MPAALSLAPSIRDVEDQSAAGFFRAFYAEVRSLGARMARRCDAGTGSLVHEAYLALAQRQHALFPDRGRFFAYAARVMRGIAIDRLRQRAAAKRGGHLHHTTLDPQVVGGQSSPEPSDLVAALAELERVDPSLAELVDLHFFAGLSFAEIATLRESSERTVQRHWERARIFLHRALRQLD